MKKLLTIAFAFAAFVTLASSADAQTRRNDRVQNTEYKRTNDRGVRVYNETKIVWQGRQQFRETYQVKVFQNGKTTSKLISRVKINDNRNDNAGIRTSYQTQTVKKGSYAYRETYQVTTFRNGRVERKLIKSVRI